MGSWLQSTGIRGQQSNGIHPTALPVVSIQATNPGAWLEVVQRALRETSGVFVISDLQKEMDWREACILSDMLLRSYLSATQHNPFGLHPGVDLEKGEALSTSQLRSRGSNSSNLIKTGACSTLSWEPALRSERCSFSWGGPTRCLVSTPRFTN